MRAVTVLALFGLVAVVPSTAVGQSSCPQKPVNVLKPALSGEVNDGSRQLRFEWISSARSDRGGRLWSIKNSVCNMGDTNLIISWPKALIFVSAYSPLPPGKFVMNSFTAGSEPQPDGQSPITYGFNRGTTSAHTYQVTHGEGKVATLSSGVFAAMLSPDMSPAERLQPIEMNFLSAKTTAGYQFSITPKSFEASKLSVAISSTQNAQFVAAYQKAGIALKVAPLRELLTSVPPEYISFSDQEFVIIPAGSRMSVDIPVVGSNIEQATLILIDDKRQPVTATRASIYKP